jgi:hypothetical protein
MFVGLGRGGSVSGNSILPIVVSLLLSNLTPLAKSKFLVTFAPPISWYKRSELGSRIAVFFSAATIAGAFSVYITLRQGSLLTNAVAGQVASSPRPSITWTASADGLGGHGFSS